VIEGSAFQFAERSNHLVVRRIELFRGDEVGFTARHYPES
jgi:hypothetical protein